MAVLQMAGRQRTDGLWLAVIGIAVLFFLILPTLIVIPMSFSDAAYLEFPPKAWSFRWYREYFGSTEWMAATRTSILAAILTTLIATPMGALAAYGLHCSSPRIRNAAQNIVVMPIVVPVILVAVGVFHLYAKLGLNYTLAGIVIAHVALALPFVIITVLSGLKSYDFNQELAARSMGASRARAMLDVTLPQVKFSVQAGAFLAFITSLDEVVVAMLISGGDNATVTRRMFNALRDQIEPTVAAISTCLIAISLLALIGVQSLTTHHDWTSGTREAIGTMVSLRRLKRSSEGSRSGGSVACAYPFLDFSCRSDHNLAIARNSLLRESGQESGEADGAYELPVRPEDRTGDSGNIRVPLAETDVDALLSNSAGLRATAPAKCFQNLPGRTDAKRGHVTLLDVITRQSARVDTVQAYAHVAARYVERRAFVGLSHKIVQDGPYDDAEVETLPEHRSQTPQHRAQVIEAVSVPLNVPEAFQRDGESQDGRFGKPASLRQILELVRVRAVVKDVQQGKGALDRLDAGETVVPASLGTGGPGFAFLLRHDHPLHPCHASRGRFGPARVRRRAHPRRRESHIHRPPRGACDGVRGGGSTSFLPGGG